MISRAAEHARQRCLQTSWKYFAPALCTNRAGAINSNYTSEIYAHNTVVPGRVLCVVDTLDAPGAWCGFSNPEIKAIRKSNAIMLPVSRRGVVRMRIPSIRFVHVLARGKQHIPFMLILSRTRHTQRNWRVDWENAAKSPSLRPICKRTKRTRERW